MFPSRVSFATTILRTGATVAALLILFAGAAAAQPTPECLQALSPLLEDTSNNCIGHPTNPKYFDTSTFLWGGRTQLAVNVGNEIQLWDISDATDPDEGDFSAFPVDNQGDSDYDLLNHSICDECRWGFATFKLANVIFDLGTNPSIPDFTTQGVYPTAAEPLGGFMFKIGSQQYLLANALPDDCGGDATLYKVNGVDESDIQQIGCVDVPGYNGKILNGAQLFKNGTHYVYLGMGNRQIYIYEVQDFGSTINLQFASQPANFKAFLSRGKGLGIDKASELAVTALVNDGFRIWDVSNPAGPVQRAHVPFSSSLNVNTAAIRYPFVWVARTLVEDSSKTYNIEVPSSPVEMDPAFWHPDHPWNSHSEECEWPQGASFSDDGNTMYFARYSVVQMIDFTVCGGPVQPTANMNIAPTPAFPDDVVTVTDTSFGSVDRTAIWITPSSNPGGTVLAGSRSYGTSSTLDYRIARAIAANQERWAHVAVENDDFPCDPLGSCPAQQIKAQEILIEREPQASISISPPNPITGNQIQMTATAEGTPGGPGDIYEWRVFNPSGGSTTYAGQTVNNVPLDESGDWQIKLTVHYEHEAEGGGLYDAVTWLNLDGISSVSADISVPLNPLNTEPITLDGSNSNWSTGANLQWNWSVTGPTNYGGCPNASTCTISADTLSPGSYTVELTLVNTNNGDQSVASDTMNVADGSIQLDLDISDTTPDIGQQVFFDITGVPGDVDQASWNYGGSGCPDFPQFVTCDTPPYCDTGIHKYATAGTKTVTLSVVIDGNTFGPISRNLTVNSTGDCGGGGGGGGGTCTYNIAPDDAEFDASGGTGAVIVSTQSGCPWSATSQAGWIEITGGSSGSGNGSVSFSVDPNPNSGEREGTMLIAGKTFTVTQFPSVPTNFSISNSSPDIGEEVIFAVSAGLIPESWDFQSPDCGWNPPTVDCSSNPSACESFTRTFAQAGLYDVTLETTTGTKTRTVWVRNQGDCTGICSSDGPPDPTFTVTPNPVQGGQVVEFFHSEEPVVVECEYIVDPVSITVPASGGGGSITVATHPDCSWFASDDRSWISITGEPLMGTGPVIVNFQVEENSDGAARMGHVYVGGQNVSINQESNGGSGAGGGGGNGAAPLPVGISVSNATPQIGEVVEFDITGYGGDVEAHWDFGGTGCSPFNQIDTCYPTYTSCLETTFKYASAGAKTASVTVYNPDNGVEIGSATVNLTVQTTGTCGGCVYNIAPLTGNFPIAGGTGTINVTTNAGCGWDADPSHNWITILSGESGEGNGTIQYSVDTNISTPRQGNIQVVNKLHTINQEGTGGGGGGGGGTDEATEWLWTVTLDGAPVLTSTDPNFTHVFGVAGLYLVELEASNCAGPANASQILQVTAPPPPDDFLVPAAAHAPGLYDTVWRTDLRILNPCSSEVDVNITYLPEGTNNNGGLTYGLHFMLASNATRIFDDIVDQIPGIEGDDNKGSLRFTFDGGQGCNPLIVSRTYNDTPEGTFGQFVPAVPVLPLVEDRIFLTGLVHDFYYRTNIGLANFGENDVGGIILTVFDEYGEQLGEVIETWVPGYSTRQIVEVIERAGILEDVNIFSVTIDTNGADLTTYASVIDNLTGDPVLYTAGDIANATVWIPGIAHLQGANDSLWRSDLTFLNHTDDLLSARIDFVPESAQGDDYFVEVQGIQPGSTFYFVDVLDTIVPGVDTKGYFVVHGLSGSIVPQFVAKTYNLAPEGGTFGQNLQVFGESDLIHMGESAYIPGIGNSSDSSEGFRTNLGVLNTNPDQSATVSITVYDTDGSVITGAPAITLAPAQFLQENIFDVLGIGDMDGAASVEIGVVSGGPVAAYASEIDNRTQDPILIPAVTMESPQ